MIAKISVWLGLSLLSALLYRMGGSDTFNTKWRDIGCMLSAMVLLIYFDGFHYSANVMGGLALMAILTFASLTSYFKKKGTDSRWFNWIFVGLAYSLSALPFAYVTGLWWGFIVRTILLTFSIVAIREFSGEVIIEECGSGFLLTSTIPLLLIGV